MLRIDISLYHWNSYNKHCIKGNNLKILLSWEEQNDMKNKFRSLKNPKEIRKEKKLNDMREKQLTELELLEELMQRPQILNGIQFLDLVLMFEGN